MSDRHGSGLGFETTTNRNANVDHASVSPLLSTARIEFNFNLYERAICDLFSRVQAVVVSTLCSLFYYYVKCLSAYKTYCAVVKNSGSEGLGMMWMS